MPKTNNKMNKDKVLLAFSGGLDTSYCVKYLLHEKSMEVHTAIVNTGGFSKSELKEVGAKAMSLGAHSHVSLEETNNYYQQIIKYLIFGNVLRSNTYPLSVSAERIHQAVAIATYAQKIGAKYIAHGSTGAGNDQVRFDLVFQLIAPEIKIITPIRDQQLSRQQEIEYLVEHGVDLSWEKAKYSVNKGLWGTSVGGDETLTSHKALPEDAYPSQLQRDEPQEVVLTFKEGELCGLNGQFLSPVEAIQHLDHIGNQYCIGRDVHVGDTIIGLKGRVGFEAAAAAMVIKAHHTLEKHVLTKWQLHWKEQLSNWYGMFVHEGQYFDPCMRNIENFLESTQQHVSGDVMLSLHPYRFSVNGVHSEFDLMRSGFGTYGEINNAWSGEDVKGFTKILANPIQIFNHLHKEQ